MLKTVLSLLLAASLGACSTSSGSSPSPTQTVFAAKTAYVGALALAVRYNQLPRCGVPASPPLCSDASIVMQLRKADATAAAALDGAETIVRQPGVKDSLAIAAATTATEAVKVLQIVLTTYQVK